VIPRIIHQIYMQGWEAIPEDVKLNIAALRERNPNWEYRFYDEASGRKFIADHLPEYLPAYDRIEPAYFAARADFLRYCACYVEGGFYLDVKSVARKPLDEILRPDDHLVLSQWTLLRGKPAQHTELQHIIGCEYVIFFIASSRANPLLRKVIEKVAKNIADYRLRDGVGARGVLRLSGPIAYSLAIEANRARHPHRIAHMEDDLQLQASMYNDHFSHRTRLGRHYSELFWPVVRIDPLRTALALIYFGALAPQFSYLRGKTSRMLDKLHKLLQSQSA
jgi:mannosyltransferase OCH1-like enzyme